jgi:putative peptidoglycan lipid II flippase
MAIGAIIGGALQFVVQLPALRGEGFRFRWIWAPRDPALHRIVQLMLPATVGLAATQLNILIDTQLASQFGDGPITYLALAFRLIQLPIGLFGVALGTVSLTRLSRDLAQNDPQSARANLAGALRMAAVLTLPATFGLVALREPIVRVLFEHGQFGSVDSRRTGATLLCYALGLFAYSVTKIQVPAFYALGDTRTAVVGSGLAVAGKIAASFLFIELFRRAGGDAFLGLALSTSLAAWIHFGWLAWKLRQRVGGLGQHRVVGCACTMLVLSVAMGALCLAVHEGLERGLPGVGWSVAALRLGLAIAAGGGALFLALRWIDLPESRILHRRR